MGKVLMMAALLAAHAVMAQTKSVHPSTKKRAPTVVAAPAPPIIYTTVEERAAFPTGQSGLDAFLSDHLRYPEAAAEEGIQGRVFVQFLIDEQGRVGGARVVRSLSRDCDTEALHVVRAMPQWRPAKFNDEGRSSVFLLAIDFKKVYLPGDHKE